MWSQKTPADKSRPLSSLQPSPSSFLYCVVFVFPAPNKCERCSWVRGRRSLKVCSGGVNIHPSEHTTEEYLHTSQSFFSLRSVYSLRAVAAAGKSVNHAGKNPLQHMRWRRSVGQKTDNLAIFSPNPFCPPSPV